MADQDEYISKKQKQYNKVALIISCFPVLWPFHGKEKIAGISVTMRDNILSKKDV